LSPYIPFKEGFLCLFGELANMSKLLSESCPVCGKVFTFYASWPRKYCSNDCYLRQKQEGKYQVSNCPTCRKEFSYLKTWPRKFCTNVCAGKANVVNIKHFAPTRREVICQQCGGKFETTEKRTRGRFCSRHCHALWVVTPEGKAERPVPPPVLGRCLVCGKEYKTHTSDAGRRKTCSKACMGKRYSDAWSGEGNPQWQGGYEPYYGPSWRPAQKKARRRDKGCQRCGKSPADIGQALDVHHIVRFANFGIERHIEANALSNLICYCRHCHLSVEPRRSPSPAL
jgi:hypothetical protein